MLILYRASARYSRPSHSFPPTLNRLIFIIHDLIRDAVEPRFDRRLMEDASDSNHTTAVDGAAEHGAMSSQLGSARDLRRLRLSQDSLGWSGDGNSSVVDEEDFVPAWGGGSDRAGGGRGSRRGSHAVSLYGSAYGGSNYGGGGGGGGGGIPSVRSSLSIRSQSVDSEFYDAVDERRGGGDGGGGGSSSGGMSPFVTPIVSPAESPGPSPVAAASPLLSVEAARVVTEAGEVGSVAAFPQSGGEGTGSGEEACRPAPPGAETALSVGVGSDGEDRVEGGGIEIEAESDDGHDDVDFQDARDPVSEVNVAFRTATIRTLA